MYKLSLLFLLAATCNPGQKKTNNIPVTAERVVIESGLLSGIAGTDSTVKIFKGIPFARPPLGVLRWKPPVPPNKWDGIRKCDTFSASAMQAKPAPFAMWSKEFMAPEEPLSEDCLYLNVWTSARYQQDKLPVIVWIHGGAFTGGSGSVPLYDGEEMARKGVVCITINYRLGIFGFLAHPELSEESPNKVSGNYGILDQIAALQWVKKNGTAFGGDTSRITIAGQSAGSMSVNALMVSPLANGLFRRAIAQSGGMFNPESGTNLAGAEQSGVNLLKQLKINSIAELRSMSADELLKKGGRIGLTIDDYVIPPTYATFKAGKQNDVPLLTGWNEDEMAFFVPPTKALVFKQDAVKQFGNSSGDFLKLFSANSDAEATESQKLLSVLSFGGQNYRWAMMQNETGKNKAYLYYFRRVPPGEPDYGAFHSAEFGYALKTLKIWNRPFSAYDHQLAEMMSSYWVNFAATGDPNGKDLPLWPAFTKDTKQVILFGDEVKQSEVPFREQLEFLEWFDFGRQDHAK
jgi:para-nitrobenzyl esterase